MKKNLGRAVSALMGLGLLFSVTACAGGDSGSSVPVVPKVESVAAAELEASGATTSIEKDEDIFELVGALMEDPIIDISAFAPPVFKNSIAPSLDLVGAELIEDMPALDFINELMDEFDGFMGDLMNIDENGKSSAKLSYEKELDLASEGIDGLNAATEGSLKIAINLSASGKASGTQTSMKMTQSFSGSASEAVNSIITPDEESALKKTFVASAGAVTLSGVSITDTMIFSEEGEMEDVMTGKGTVYVTGAVTAGTSVCTASGLGGKLLISAETLASVKVADVMEAMSEIKNVIGGGDDSFEYYSDDLFDKEKEGSKLDLMDLVNVTLKITVKAYNDDNEETYSKTFNSIEELMEFIPDSEGEYEFI